MGQSEFGHPAGQKAPQPNIYRPWARYHGPMWLERMKWPDVGQLTLSSIPVVIPLGSFEQHGPHLPLTTDTDIVTAVARRVHDRMKGDVLITPTLWLGHSPHHMRFPGTLSVDSRPYVEMVKGLVRSVVHHGATHVFLLNGHGGNEGPAPTILRELKTELPGAFVTFASYWWLGAKTLTAVRESGMGGVGHACEMETSVMLVASPDLVDMTKARKAGPGPALRYRVVDMQAGNPVLFVSEFDELSDSGVLGEPERATAAKGEAFLDGFAGAVADFLEDFRTWTAEKVKGTTISGG